MMTMTRWRMGLIGGAAAGVVAGLAGGMTQPQRETPPARAQHRSPEQVREMITWQLRETDQRIERYQVRRAQLAQAMERLDDGASPREIFAQMRPARDRASDRFGQARVGDRPLAEGRSNDRPSRDRIEIPNERLMAALDEHLPELAAQLRTLRHDEPDKFSEMVHRLGPRFAEVLELRQSDPQMARLKFQDMRAQMGIAQAARTYTQARHSTDDAGPIREARRHLGEALEQAFESRMAIRLLELQRLRDRIEAIESEMIQQRDARDEFIARQFERIERSERFSDMRRDRINRRQGSQGRRPGDNRKQ